MKIFLLLFLFLVSCAEQVPPGLNQELGVIRTFEPLEVSSADIRRIQLLCEALMEKEGLLPVLVSSRTEYQFDFAQKNCSDEALPGLKPVVTTIQGFDPYYSFVTLNAGQFGFPSVETASTGVMSDICEEVRSARALKSPMQTTKGAIWFSTNTSSDHCQATDTAYCIQIQTGSPHRQSSYRIHTNEWLKIKIVNPLRGFFIERKLISTGSCQTGSRLEKFARLR